MSDTFDYVIVGGGTAAGIIAYRLSERGNSVCVLEAGPADYNPYIRIPAGFIKTLFNEKITWQFASQPNPNSGNRPVQYTQGKTLGGSSAVNGMVYNRGQAQDFDGWAALGNLGWGYDDILPYFRRTETRVGEADEHLRGKEGRLTVSTSEWPSDAVDKFIEAAQQRGHPFNPDYNGASQKGVGLYQSTIKNGRRDNTASAFLHPARKRYNVDVRCNAMVEKILFAGTKATGVRYSQGGAQKRLYAGKKVILSAGVTQSPKLLQLSGVGPADLLAQYGIPIVHSLPGVGENFHDHYSPRIVMRGRTHVDTLNAHVNGVALLKQIINWLRKKPSVLTLSPALVHVFGSSQPDEPRPDYSLVFTPASYKEGFIGRLDDYPGMTCGAWQMRPESRGTVRIQSANPQDAPLLDPNYLAAEKDRQVLIAGLKEARAIMATTPFAELVDHEIFPGRDVRSDDEWLSFAQACGNSSYHLVGSCKMGPNSDAQAVVDSRLHVYGVQNLVVADASIMPAVTSANTYASTMMIAEKAADMLLQDALR